MGPSFIGEMAYWVYILKSELDSIYYVGHTADLKERIRRHNNGRNLYTKTKMPWKLVYQEEFSSRSEASRREREIKGKKSRDFIERLVRTSRV
jgi:putative endonuclease